MSSQHSNRPAKNVLAGMACPKCGQDEIFAIEAKSTFFITDDGVDDYDNPEWLDTNAISCQCGWEGTVKDTDIIEL